MSNRISAGGRQDVSVEPLQVSKERTNLLTKLITSQLERTAESFLLNLNEAT